jgi:hypothetical protein
MRHARPPTPWARLLGLPIATSILACAPPLPTAATLAQQRAQYDAEAPKTILELQAFRRSESVLVPRAGGATAVATLTDLNPYIGSWYLLTVQGLPGTAPLTYHLETARRQTLHLSRAEPDQIRIGGDHGLSCVIRVSSTAEALEEASSSGLPYAPLCGGLLYLRDPVAGHHTSLERMTDFLRDHVWGGERVISIVKRELYHDAFVEKEIAGSPTDIAPQAAGALSPQAAVIAPDQAERPIYPEHLALDVASGRELLPGQWYPIRSLAGVFASVVAPENLEERILSGPEASVNPLDSVEARALVLLVAFDLQSLRLHFALGTDHPRLDWSVRPPDSSWDPRLPGPDGIANAAPLVTNGMVSPVEAGRTIATFAGGFKRIHGAFHTGPLAERNHGSHYGFIEAGVIFSKLQPGLATVVVTDADGVDMRTWSPEDDSRLPHVRYARQNGVPLLEYDAKRGIAVPGAMVNQWGPGNWSGSVNEDLRTLRGGLCLQESGGRRYLIYAYFSAATPSAMARVFQGYRCRYAMQLDINAPEHTYLALYVHQGEKYLVEHLVEAMSEVDRETGGQVAPRFLSFPDDRDFFYLTREDSDE